MVMKNERPILIVISSNRNYGWVVPAFLRANTQWADYIVITDQMSTDCSREMYAQYDNVIVVDDKDMQFKENTRAKMAFDKGREIADGRDVIFFALDIDEILPSNWMRTADGKKILNSKPGDMFELKWANVNSDRLTYFENPAWQYRIFHDNGMNWQDCKHELHAPHLPYSTYEVSPCQVTDFYIIHFGWYHKRWRSFNLKYYGVLDIHQKRSKSVISVNRGYYYPDPKTKDRISRKLKEEWLYPDFNVFDSIDLNALPQGVELIKEILSQEGVKKYRGVDIWDEDLCNELQIKDPRTKGWKMLHWYLRKTQPYRYTFIIRAIDKIFKQFI